MCLTHICVFARARWLRNMLYAVRARWHCSCMSAFVDRCANRLCSYLANKRLAGAGAQLGCATFQASGPPERRHIIVTSVVSAPMLLSSHPCSCHMFGVACNSGVHPCRPHVFTDIRCGQMCGSSSPAPGRALRCKIGGRFSGEGTLDSAPTCQGEAWQVGAMCLRRPMKR